MIATSTYAPPGGVGLYLNAIQRLDEARGFGTPSFAIGGAAADERGRLSRIPAFVVAKNFEVGETRRFAGLGRLLHLWREEAGVGPTEGCAAMLYVAAPETTEKLADAVSRGGATGLDVRPVVLEPLRPDETVRTLTLTYDDADGRYQVWCSLAPCRRSNDGRRPEADA